MRATLDALIDTAQVPVRVAARALAAQLDGAQLRAAYGVLVTQPTVSVVAGPGGTGKSALLRLIALLEPSIAVATPTNGARRADQAVVDGVLPPRGYKPQLQVGTTHTSFGVGFGGRWDADAVTAGGAPR